MLDLTLATTFRPGTNLKGDVAGANWSFVLPRLDLERIVCVGVPAISTLTALTRIGRQIVVVCTSRAEARRAETCRQKNGLGELEIIWDTPTNVDAVATGSTDLIVLVGGRHLRRLSRSGRLQSECRRILKSGGLIYAEMAGPAGWIVRRLATRRLRRTFAAVETLWLTPLRGEAHTAVPRRDAATRCYFLDKATHSPSIQWKRRERSNQPTESKNSDQGNQRAQSTNAANERPQSSTRRRLKAALQLAAYKRLTQIQRWEAKFLKGPGRAALLERCGLLIGQEGHRSCQEPPEYLKQIARESGVELSDCRWGMAACGDYSSRKVLFFLFDPPSGPSAAPRFVVKLTRHPDFNARLQRERDALVHLHSCGVGQSLGLPEIAFSGEHGGLAILGESAIDAVPFDRRSSFEADCSVARRAVRALTELAGHTANKESAVPAQIAGGMQRLLDRFLAIYEMTPHQRAFLESQIETIRHCGQPVPLVFQHGDPGRWNVLVRADGRPVFLDWESAEPAGMPLWDLYYFLRSFCVGAGRARGTVDAVDAFFERFVNDESFSTLVHDATLRYCERIELPAELVSPLFYTCWMHRALKESTRLVPSRLQSGHYVRLLRRCIAERETPSLGRLVSPHRPVPDAAADDVPESVADSARWLSPRNPVAGVLNESRAEQ